MSVQKRSELVVRAELRVLVTRNGRGDLHDGVHERLDRIDAVVGVEDVDVSGLRPGLNDLAVDLAATLRLRADGDDDADAETLAARLREGFGVERAEVTVASREESNA